MTIISYLKPYDCCKQITIIIQKYLGTYETSDTNTLNVYINVL